jgi:ribosome maturation factor RimP
MAGWSGSRTHFFLRVIGGAAVSGTAIEARLRAALEPEIEALGFECVEILFASEAGRRIMRITLDSEHGVKLDECAAVSRALAPILEGLESLPGHYYLEVSSPGINRPLTKPAHFQRFLGERAKLQLTEKLEGGLTVTGVLRDLQDGVLFVETSVGLKRVPLEQIQRARLHRDLGQVLKAASGRTPASAADDDQ